MPSDTAATGHAQDLLARYRLQDDDQDLEAIIKT